MPDMNLNTPVAPANMPVGQANPSSVGKTAPAPQKKMPNVTPAMQQDQGAGGQKKASQIVADYVMQQTGDQQKVNQIMAGLAELIKRKLSRLVQFGNTVFWATQAGRGTIDVHIASQESPKVLAKRCQQFYGWAKQHGFTKITSTITDQQQLGIVKLAGIPFTMKQTQVNDGHKMVPGSVMTIEVR